VSAKRKGKRKNAISYRAARECENATTPARLCECRCGGAGHGKARGRPEDLPIDDPHAAVPRSGRCRICGCTPSAPCTGPLWAYAIGLGRDGRACSWMTTSHLPALADGNGRGEDGKPPELVLRRTYSCEWMDKARTFCSAHHPDELRAWGLERGPASPGRAPRGDVPTRGELERRDRVTFRAVELEADGVTSEVASDLAAAIATLPLFGSDEP
jgi:hypothetical protein